MYTEEYIAALRAEGVRAADAAERAGLDAPVPACPGWRVRDVLAHLGRVHAWALEYVAGGRTTPPTPAENAQDRAEVADDELPGWFRSGHLALVDALEAADESLACWSFLPAPSPRAFWARRQAHETAIHRADVESALPGPADTDVRWAPGFAADGIDELLTGFFARPGGRLVADPPRSMVVVAGDADAAWTVRIGPGGCRTAAGRRPADLTLSGTASDLYLLLWNRGGTGRLRLDGDPEVLRLWREHAKVIW